jgi:hypothetical protein
MIKHSNGLSPSMPLTLSQFLSIRKPVQYSTHTHYTGGTENIKSGAWVTPGGNICATRNSLLLGLVNCPSLCSFLAILVRTSFGLEKNTNFDKDDFLF